MRSPRRVTLQPMALALANVEASDGLLGTRGAGLLARDHAQVSHGGVELLGIVSGLAHAHVHDDLLKTGNPC